MTDEQINRAVAEARGYTVYHYDKDFAENCYYMLMDGEFMNVVRYPDCHRDTEEAAWADVPDVVNQWGAFFEELAATMPQVQVLYTYGQSKPWRVVLWQGHKMFDMVALSPGRALALAFLKAKGVSV